MILMNSVDLSPCKTWRRSGQAAWPLSALMDTGQKGWVVRTKQYTYVCLRRKLVLNGDRYNSAILGRLRRNVCRGWLALATVVDRMTC